MVIKIHHSDFVFPAPVVVADAFPFLATKSLKSSFSRAKLRKKCRSVPRVLMGSVHPLKVSRADCCLRENEKLRKRLSSTEGAQRSKLQECFYIAASLCGNLKLCGDVKQVTDSGTR